MAISKAELVEAIKKDQGDLSLRAYAAHLGVSAAYLSDAALLVWLPAHSNSDRPLHKDQKREGMSKPLDAALEVIRPVLDDHKEKRKP